MSRSLKTSLDGLGTNDGSLSPEDEAGFEVRHAFSEVMKLPPESTFVGWKEVGGYNSFSFKYPGFWTFLLTSYLNTQTTKISSTALSVEWDPYSYIDSNVLRAPPSTCASLAIVESTYVPSSALHNI